MSRRAGPEARTIAMQRALDEQAFNWTQFTDLSLMIQDRFDVEPRYADQIVHRWIKSRGPTLQHVGVRRNSWWCNRLNIKPDAHIAASAAWHTLPQHFRRNHPIGSIPASIWDDAILLARLAFNGDERALAAFNNYAEQNRFQKIRSICQ